MFKLSICKNCFDLKTQGSRFETIFKLRFQAKVAFVDWSFIKLFDKIKSHLEVYFLDFFHFEFIIINIQSEAHIEHT